MEIVSTVITAIISLLAISISIYTFKTNKKYNLMKRQPLFQINSVNADNFKNDGKINVFIIEKNNEPYIITRICLTNEHSAIFLGKGERTRERKRKGETEVISRVEGYPIQFLISKNMDIKERIVIEYEDFEGQQRIVYSDFLEISDNKIKSKLAGSSFIFRKDTT